jgi:signal transduction histidine kinase/CHASE3 domain sensor protein
MGAARSTSSALRRQLMWLVAVLAVVGTAQVIGGLVLLTRFDAYSAHVDVAQNAHQRMLQAMTDAETGVRGWELTGDPGYLEPYEAGLSALPEAIREVTAEVGDRETRRLLAVEQDAAEHWLDDFAAPLAALSAPRAADPARGKTLFDAYRRTHAATAADLAASRREVAREYRTISGILQSCLVVLAVLAVLVAVRISVRTHRMLLVPLAQVQEVLSRLAGGDRAARADPRGPPEVRVIAETLNRSLDDAEDARQGLLATHRELSQILDVLNVAVVTCDAEGTIVRVNRTAREDVDGEMPAHVSGLNRIAEPGSRPGDPGAAGPPAGAHPLALALAGRPTTAKEMNYLRPGHPPKAVMVDACPLRDDGGRIVGAVATRYDVSALRAREAELTAFAGVVAHDLRSPLAAVAGFIELLELDLRGTGAGAEVGDTVARIRAGVDRMRQLIDDLLVYATARDKPLRPEPVPLDSVIDEVVAERTAHLPAGPARPEVVRGALPVLRADAAMVRQMMDNLIGNAFKYTGRGEPARVRITAERLGEDWARITVADRGIGIPAEQRASVFDSFHRAHAEQAYAGTGLGLAICRRVVDRHGGSITLDDNPLGGTCFHIVLPAEPPPDGKSAAHVATAGGAAE